MDERAKIAIAESERLKQYLGSLLPEAWSKPSVCDRWEVRDVVAHIAWTAESYIEGIHQRKGSTKVCRGTHRLRRVYRLLDQAVRPHSRKATPRELFPGERDWGTRCVMQAKTRPDGLRKPFISP